MRTATPCHHRETLPLKRGVPVRPQAVSAHKDRRRPQRTARSAFAMAEVLVSLLLVSGLLVVALNAAGAAKMSYARLEDRSWGRLIAAELMSELMAMPFSDPDDTPLFGLEPTDDSSSRAGLDDFDDYVSWCASPPQQSDGTEMADLTGWQRCVTIRKVRPTNITQPLALLDEGLRDVVVTVTRNGIEIARLLAYRAEEPVLLDVSGNPIY